jgi:hypothetical protein
MLYRSMMISAFGKSALEYATYIRVVPAPTFSIVASNGIRPRSLWSVRKMLLVVESGGSVGGPSKHPPW